MSKWTSASCGDRLVGLGLHPLLESRLALQLVCGVGLERGDGLLDGRARLDPLGHLPHLLVQPGALLDAPAVGLLEVDRGADEVARHQAVPLDPAGVLLGRGVEQLGAEEVTHAPVGVGGLSRGRGQRLLGVTGEGFAVDRRAGDQRGEVPVVRREVGALLDALVDLAAGGHVTLVASGEQRLLVLAECCRQLGHPGGERRPARLGVLGHEVEDVAQVLQRGRDDVERHLVEAGRVDLLVQLEPVAQRGDRHAVDVVDRFDVGQGGQGLPAQRGERGSTGGGDVVEVLFVARDAGVGRHDRAQPDGGVEVVVRDAVGVGAGACGRARGVGVGSHARERIPGFGRRARGFAGRSRPPVTLARSEAGPLRRGIHRRSTP